MTKHPDNPDYIWLGHLSGFTITIPPHDNYLGNIVTTITEQTHDCRDQ